MSGFTTFPLFIILLIFFISIIITSLFWWAGFNVSLENVTNPLLVSYLPTALVWYPTCNLIGNDLYLVLSPICIWGAGSYAAAQYGKVEACNINNVGEHLWWAFMCSYLSLELLCWKSTKAGHKCCSRMTPALAMSCRWREMMVGLCQGTSLWPRSSACIRTILYGAAVERLGWSRFEGRKNSCRRFSSLLWYISLETKQ